MSERLIDFAKQLADEEIQALRAEIKRLRLTDEEREAVEWCRDNITAMAHPSSAFAHIHAHSLRGLLARCATGHQRGQGTGQIV